MYDQNKTKRAKSRQKGFTLVELLVAIGIVSASLTAAMSLVQRGLFSTFNARDQITAFYLAQDAIEMIRSVRDSNKLSNRTGTVYQAADYWLAGLDNSGGGSSLCISADPGNLSHCKLENFSNNNNTNFAPRFSVCPGTCGGFMKYVQDQGMYGYWTSGPLAASPASKFSRDIFIISPYNGDPNEAQLVVTARWRVSGGTTRQVTLTEFLKNF